MCMCENSPKKSEIVEPSILVYSDNVKLVVNNTNSITFNGLEYIVLIENNQYDLQRIAKTFEIAKRTFEFYLIITLPDTTIREFKEAQERIFKGRK